MHSPRASRVYAVRRVDSIYAPVRLQHLKSEPTRTLSSNAVVRWYVNTVKRSVELIARTGMDDPYPTSPGRVGKRRNDASLLLLRSGF